MKKWISVLLDTDVQIASFAGTPIEKVAGYINSFKSQYPAHRNLCLKYRHFYEDVGFDLWGEREETDEEYTFRLELEKKREARKVAKKEKKEKQERYLFERLKAKYG